MSFCIDLLVYTKNVILLERKQCFVDFNPNLTKQTKFAYSTCYHKPARANLCNNNAHVTTNSTIYEQFSVEIFAYNSWLFSHCFVNYSDSKFGFSSFVVNKPTLAFLASMWLQVDWCSAMTCFSQRGQPFLPS